MHFLKSHFKLKLIFLALEPTEPPTFILPLSNVMARAGQKIKLECEVSGLPLPILTWSHNGKPVKETRESKVCETLSKFLIFNLNGSIYLITTRKKLFLIKIFL